MIVNRGVRGVGRTRQVPIVRSRVDVRTLQLPSLLFRCRDVTKRSATFNGSNNKKCHQFRVSVLQDFCCVPNAFRNLITYVISTVISVPGANHSQRLGSQNMAYERKDCEPMTVCSDVQAKLSDQMR